MPRLIIGHTTDTTSTIWVRGDPRYPVAIVELEGPEPPAPQTLELEERHGFTGAAKFAGLEPEREYSCRVYFGRTEDRARRCPAEFGHTTGRFKTFPPPAASRKFSFLLGSCNLHSLGVVTPPDTAFETLHDVVTSEELRPAFMIHCGDQIYYDAPIPWKSPDIEEYRDKYIDAWGDSRPTRRFLTQMPQYMVLDDHEIINDFANDMSTWYVGATTQQIKQCALKVYREFVHIRQPHSFGWQPLYYKFSHGQAQFFVLDTRTQRFASSDQKRIMAERQLGALTDWLAQHADDLKFVVTSVPFVAEVRDSEDKWNFFREQRDQVMEHIVQRGVKRTVFLTGDMHNSHYATLDISANGGTTRVHELMSSPLNQISKADRDEYEDGPANGHTQNMGLAYTSTLQDFYAEHSNAMLITVDGRDVHYEVFRTKRVARNEIADQFTP